jgi:hypothetical protein
MRRLLAPAVGLLALVAAGAAAPAAESAGAAPAAGSADAAAIASLTFVRACAAHFGAQEELRAKLQPGHDMYLPRLSAQDARPFLQGREGEAYARFDAGTTLALLDDGQCVVFVQKVKAERLYHQLDTDLTVAVGSSFAVQAGGQETKGPMLARFIDLVPAGDYRTEMKKRLGTEPAGLRVTLTTSETAQPNLQAIITIGPR